MKSPIKVRVDIEQDMSCATDSHDKRYRVIRWVFERKTGRTVDHFIYGTNYSFKEAHAAKKMILDSYFG